MEEYRSNSKKSRENTVTPAVSDTPKRTVDKLTTGPVKTKKKSVGSKLMRVFIPEDVTDVKEYMIYGVVVPMVKNAICDTVNELLGGGRRVGSRNRVGSGVISYGAISNGRSNRDTGVIRRPGFEYDDIIVASSGEAYDILDLMEEIISQYKVASLADLYQCAGLQFPHTYQKYGWKDISSARVVRDPDGWLIKMPRAIQID